MSKKDTLIITDLDGEPVEVTRSLFDEIMAVRGHEPPRPVRAPRRVRVRNEREVPAPDDLQDDGVPTGPTAQWVAGILGPDHPAGRRNPIYTWNA